MSFVTAGDVAVTTGAVTSITVVVVAVVVFPAASVPDAVNVCDPSGNAVTGSHVHDPSAATVAVHTATPPSVTVIVEPAGKSVVPEIVGVVSFVTAGDVAVTTGAVVSTVKVWVSAVEVTPAVVCVAEMVCGPSVSCDDVHDHVPSVATTAVHRVTPPSVTVTVAPGMPVPVISGVLSLINDPSAGPLMTGGPTTVPVSLALLLARLGSWVDVVAVAVFVTVPDVASTVAVTVNS